jgi:hypothetical protein
MAPTQQQINAFRRILGPNDRWMLMGKRGFFANSAMDVEMRLLAGLYW